MLIKLHAFFPRLEFPQNSIFFCGDDKENKKRETCKSRRKLLILSGGDNINFFLAILVDIWRDE